MVTGAGAGAPTGADTQSAPQPGEPDLLAGLDPEQRLAAETLLGPVVVLAGAGTGKTRAITHRIAHGVASGVYTAERVMALTFTTRAAGELRGRLRGLGAGDVAARTFHSAALAQLSYFWPQLVGGQLPRVLPGKAATVAQAAERLRLRLDTPTLRDVAGEIEWRKVSGLSMEDYERAAHTRALPGSLGVTAMVELHAAYERLKDERRQIDFEDVLLATAGMIEAEPVVAEQVRERYRYFVVDEYQDVSPLQHNLLQLWLGHRTDVCVVGDASQTIYSFAGATSDYLLGFASRYDDATVVRLERNYRSTRPVIDRANRLMRGRPGALVLVPTDRPAVDESAASAPEPTLSRHPDDQAEAAAVADSVAAEIAGGARPESIAILYRVNAQAAALETAFAERGISTRVLGSARFFDHPAVQQAMLVLRSVAPSRGDVPLFQAVSDVLRDVGWTLEPPPGQGAHREKWELLTALIELADRAEPGTTLQRFADELFERQAAQHEPAVAAVVLATLHSAKGLEWDSVHLVGMTEGLLPISHARGLEAIDEERRLLYVGITRARRRLAFSYSEQGMHGQRRQPSRFLDELRSGTPGAPTTAAR